jgi:D-glycero-D-manno-heptose 1,7-bisphosphate phosphatase
VGVAHGVVRAAVFLDRDGVINDPALDPVDGRYESPHDPADVVLATGAVEGLRALRDAGLLLVVASNQPSAAKGKVTLAELRAVHDRVVALLAGEGLALDDWRYCFHHPDGVVAALSGPCDCRKPAPGMLLDAARQRGIDLAASWMIGDSDGDVGAGRAAGTRTILVEHPQSAHRRTSGLEPDGRARNLSEAAALLLASQPVADSPASLPRP